MAFGTTITNWNNCNSLFELNKGTLSAIKIRYLVNPGYKDTEERVCKSYHDNLERIVFPDEQLIKVEENEKKREHDKRQ